VRPSDEERCALVMKRVLFAIAELLPDGDQSYLTKVDISRGWGDVVNIRLHTALPHSETRRGFTEKVRNAMSEILEDERHRVEIV
jgi:hypothetical protein